MNFQRDNSNDSAVALESAPAFEATRPTAPRALAEAHNPTTPSQAPPAPSGPASGGGGGSDDELFQGLPEDFAVTGILGRGGMGVVARAYQKSLDREVAIKVMPARLAGHTEFRDLFMKEARLSATLNHPNIVQIYEAGELAGGGVYFAMEMVEGKTLKQIVATEGVFGAKRGHESPTHSLAIALKYVFDLCHAAEVAHKKGVIHRDIKPENVIVDADGRARLMDFGIAILREEADTAYEACTPYNAAPEQIKGGVVDHRADVFAIAGVLLFLLTGDCPNTGETVQAISTRATRGLSMPEQRWQNTTNFLVGDLRRILKKALAASPNKRFASVADFRAALERVYMLRTGVGDARRARRQRRRALTISLVVFGVACAGAAGYYLNFRSKFAVKKVAAKEFSPDERARILADTLADLEARYNGAAPGEWKDQCLRWGTYLTQLKNGGKEREAFDFARFVKRQLRLRELQGLSATIGQMAAARQPSPATQGRIESFAAAVRANESALGTQEDLDALSAQGAAIIGDLSSR